MNRALRGALAAALLACAAGARADWFVQVAVLADSKFLDQMKVSIRAAGFPVTSEALTRPGLPRLGRLLVGPYDTRAEALAVAAQLAPLGWPGYLRERTPPRTGSSPTRAQAAPRPTPAAPRTVPPPAPAPTPVPTATSAPSLAPALPAVPPVRSTPRR